jgi:SAM-dependent methyltransferase
MTVAMDFGQQYREHFARTTRRAKDADAWDARADALSRVVFEGAYVADFVRRMQIEDCRTLLDVGCGPGTIGLTLAPRLDHVVGLDFSSRMVEAFAAQARARNITHATAIQRAWEDPWNDVPVCDVVVASRSTQVADLEAALLKMHAHARRRVYLTHKVGGRFVDADIYEALGRTDPPGPDYLYAVAILHQHGIHATVDFIKGGNRLRRCADADDCVRRVAWSLGGLTAEEEARLRRHYAARQGRIGEQPQLWAFIAWTKDA